ncbi:MAG: hypothetical protein WDA28_13110 [Castellaniella sp.]
MHHLEGTCYHGAACRASIKNPDKETIEKINKHCDTHVHIVQPKSEVIKYFKSKVAPYIPQGNRKSENLIADQHNVFETPAAPTYIPSIPNQVEQCTYVAPMPVFINGRWWTLRCSSPPAVGWDMCAACFNVYGSMKPKTKNNNES